jgi:hypothetical protein
MKSRRRIAHHQAKDAKTQSQQGIALTNSRALSASCASRLDGIALGSTRMKGVRHRYRLPRARPLSEGA